VPPNPKHNLHKLSVEADDIGSRLDVFCASKLEFVSRNQIQKANQSQSISVDGAHRPDHYELRGGEVVTVGLPVVEAPSRPQPESIPLDVTYEDNDIIVVNKPAGMVTHPAHGNWEGTLVNAVLGRGVELSALGGSDRPGVVHRLDKDTSGLIILAKNDAAYKGLTAQIKAREMKKIYHAIVWGNLGVPQRSIDAPIARHTVHRQKMTVDARRGRAAFTDVFVVDSFGHFDYIRVATLTGRTHQIRVHLAHIAHPILGDSVYGGQRKKHLPSNARIRTHVLSVIKTMPRHALHASKLALTHPRTGDRLKFKTALPEDMRLTLEKLTR